MPLYHISCREYVNGQVLPIRNEASNYHLRAVEAGMGWINDILDNYSPEDSPVRSHCYYAFGHVGHCLFYFKDNLCYINNNYFVYEVTLTNQKEAPMPLTDLLRIEGRHSEHVEAICQEYWSQNREWKFIEYLGDSMTIIRRVDINDTFLLMAKGRMDYDADIKARNQFIKELER